MADREIQGQTGRKMAARRDAVLIAVISIAAAIICVRLDLSEALLAWTRLHERFQLDELPAWLLVVACCLAWFSARRYIEARDQLVMRRATDARLAEALAENQRLAQQYVDMQEYERKALARDLHDELGQYLNVIKLDAVSIRDAASSGIEGAATFTGNAARAVIENVDRVYGVVSSLIRQLRPVGFDELGIAAALENCVNDWRARLPEAVIELSIDSGFDDPNEIRALALFRLVQEALTNVARHSGATRVEIRVARVRRSEAAGEFIEVSIVDNGRGTDMEAPHTGLGLVGMRERVAAFGGSLELSGACGAGFQLMASMPVHTRLDTDRPA